MFGFFNRQAREARHLNRDAPQIIEAARQSYRTELVKEIARLTDQRLQEAQTNCAGDSACLERAVTHFRTMHRESRSKLDQVGLTAYSLIIIYLRALIIGEACAPARAAIDAFINEWRHTFEEEDTAFAP